MNFIKLACRKSYLIFGIVCINVLLRLLNYRQVETIRVAK